MSNDNHCRIETRPAVRDALHKLGEVFPLQAQFESADPALRAAYVHVLLHWVSTGSSPTRDCASLPVLCALRERDILVLDEHGIGCYPFSARDIGIDVHFAEKTTHAMCAIDALAIPSLVRHPSSITARCAICRCDLACTVAANGRAEKVDPQGMRVLWRSRGEEGQCCQSLCTGIEFVCGKCAAPPLAVEFTLPEAAAIGNAFFAFQKDLLDHHGSA